MWTSIWLGLPLVATQIIAPTELRSGTDAFVYLGPNETRTWHLADAEGAEVGVSEFRRCMDLEGSN